MHTLFGRFCALSYVATMRAQDRGKVQEGFKERCRNELGESVSPRFLSLPAGTESKVMPPGKPTGR